MILCLYNVDVLNICIKEFCSKKCHNYSYENLEKNFPNIAFVYAEIVPSWVDQLLPQLLIQQFDILSAQCRHIEHMHGGYWIKNLISINLPQLSIEQFDSLPSLYRHTEHMHEGVLFQKNVVVFF